MPERTGIVTSAGNVCIICGFLPTTKNKYRELQDHHVRTHFKDRIRAALPARRPYRCPQPGCPIEGKDWQALMRHYTGKHGVLDAFLRESISSGLTLPNVDGKVKIVDRRRFKSVDVSLVLPSERVRFRRKRKSYTSAGSGSSLESLLEEEDLLSLDQTHQLSLDQTHQLAWIVKRSRPNAEPSVTFIELKALLASSSTCVSDHESQLAVGSAGGNSRPKALVSEFVKEEILAENPQSQSLEQLIQQKLAQQKPVFSLSEAKEANQTRYLDSSELTQDEQDQRLKEIEQHLLLDSEPYLLQDQVCHEPCQQTFHFQLVGQPDHPTVKMFGFDERLEQTLVQIWDASIGERIQVPIINSFQLQDDNLDTQVTQAQIDANDDLNIEDAVSSERVVVEQIPMLATENSLLLSAKVDDLRVLMRDDLFGAKQQEITFGLY